MEKINYNIVKKIFKENGFDLLTSEKEYKNTSQKLTCIDECGYLYVLSYHKLKCKRKPRKFSNKNPYSFYNMMLYFKLERKNYKLIEILTDKYIENKDNEIMIKVKHLTCGRTYETSWYNFRYSRKGEDNGCPLCYRNKLKTHEEFIKDLRDRNEHYKNGEFEVLSEYEGDNKVMTFRCSLGHEWTTTPTSILSKGSGCQKCFYLNNRGKNNPSWNDELSEEERENKRTFENNSHAIWRTKIFKRDNGMCLIINQKHVLKLFTKGRFITNAHHLNGYHWDKEGRFDINNGVSLCEPVHKLFHNLYGRKNNTKEQFQDFIFRIDSGELDNELIYNIPLRIWINLNKDYYKIFTNNLIFK